MCFSATANFVGGAGLAGVGVATLREAKHKRQLLFAAMPLLFALHQGMEGFVWLGLDGLVSHRVEIAAGRAFVFYAQGVLPCLLPLGVLLLEPTARRRRRMWPFVLLGAVLGIYLLWGLLTFPIEVSARDHSILYFNRVTTTTLVAELYVVATCGALFFSGFRDLVLLGAANLMGLIIVMLVMRYAFTSVWCAYAAVVSSMIYFHFRNGRVSMVPLVSAA